MAVNVPTAIDDVVSGRCRPNRFGSLGRNRLGSGDTIRSRELVRPVALLHLARSVQPRGWSWYHPSGIGTMTITDGTNSDNVVLASSGSESTLTGTLDISSFVAEAACLVTLAALASSGTVTVYGSSVTPQRLTASDIA
jgi:hypothetical protein